MPMLGMDRRLQSVSDAELKRYWRDLAGLLQSKVDPSTGRLPPRYEAMFARCRDEYARRGVQLALFTEP